MSALPSFMVSAAPETTPAPTVPVVAAPAEPAATAAPGQTEAVIPNQPTTGQTLPPSDAPVGRVMPGVQGADAPIVADSAPSRDVKLSFAQIAPPPGSMVLRGINPNGGIEFGMRSDEVVSKALLNLEYTPSPSLLPVQSQLKVYLNDELMGVLPVTKEQLGKKPWRSCRSTRCLSVTSTACGWNLLATIVTSVKTRPAVRCGWTWGVVARWI